MFVTKLLSQGLPACSQLVEDQCEQDRQQKATRCWMAVVEVLHQWLQQQVLTARYKRFYACLQLTC